MFEIKKKIFGFVYSFRGSDNYFDYVNQSVGLYEDSLELSPDVRVTIVPNPPIDNITISNPKVYKKNAEGFQTDFGSVVVFWKRPEGGGLDVGLHIKPDRGGS